MDEIRRWDLGFVTLRWSEYAHEFFRQAEVSRPRGVAEMECWEKRFDFWLKSRYPKVHQEIVVWDAAHSEEFGFTFFALLDEDCCVP